MEHTGRVLFAFTLANCDSVRRVWRIILVPPTRYVFRYVNKSLLIASFADVGSDAIKGHNKSYECKSSRVHPLIKLAKSQKGGRQE